MSDKEVELGNSESDDYEVVPLGPIRKLEKRIDRMQEQQVQGGGAANQEIIRDVLDIMKSNQRIVNDMTESTHELKNSVEDLTHKMDDVVDNMNDFMDLLKEASEVDMEGEVLGDMEGRIANAIGTRMDNVAADIKESNQEVVEHLENINESLRKSYASQNQNVSRTQSSQSRGGGNSNAGRNASRSRSGSRGQESSGSERVRKLKERFDTGTSDE